MMFKKFLFASAILMSTTQLATAGVPYLGISTGVATTTTTSASFRGMPGTVFAGYGSYMGQGVYVAGEIFGTIGTATITSNNSLKSTYNYGISFIPGLMLSDHTMVFGRVGLSATHFSSNATGTSATVSGVHLGVGLQTSLSQDWDVRGEYTYTASKTVTGIAGSPNTDAATIGMVYKLG